MPDVIDLPYMPGMDFGKGINLRDCTTLSNAVNAGPTKTISAGGLTVTYEFTEKTSLEDVWKSLGIDIELAGRYATVSAAGKFKYAKEVNFNSQSTFILAKCIVEKPFEQIEDPRLLDGQDGPASLIRAGKTDKFQEQYGDGFIRGMLAGGEFYAVISITSSAKNEQEEVAAELHANYDALLSSARLDGSLNDESKKIVYKAKVEISTFQQGGQGSETSFAGSLEQVMTRLANFPAAAAANPVPYTMQVATYKTIPLPNGPDPLSFENQTNSLADYSRAYLTLRQLKNEVEFMQLYPSAFKRLPPVATLNAWQKQFTDQLTEVVKKSADCSRDLNTCVPFALDMPTDYEVPERTPGIAGQWKMVQISGDTPPVVFSSQWAFTPVQGTKYEAVEAGLGNARGEGVLEGQDFTFPWASTNPSNNLTGVVAVTFNEEFTSAEGKVTFDLTGFVHTIRFTLIP